MSEARVVKTVVLGTKNQKVIFSPFISFGDKELGQEEVVAFLKECIKKLYQRSNNGPKARQYRRPVKFHIAISSVISFNLNEHEEETFFNLLFQFFDEIGVQYQPIKQEEKLKLKINSEAEVYEIKLRNKQLKHLREFFQFYHLL